MRNYVATISPVTFSYTFILTKKLLKKTVSFFHALFHGNIQDGRHWSPKVLQLHYLWQQTV